MRRGVIGAVVALVALWLAALWPVASPAQAAAVPCARGRAEGSESIVGVPWARRWLDLDRSWELVAGATRTVTVAVVDTGVDGRHPQLAAAVLPGIDLVDGGDGSTDCSGHGTGVASIVAARPDPAVGFAGIAVQAKILPVRVAERIDSDMDPGRVAAGVDWAVNQGVPIILMAYALPGDAAVVRAAVARAVARNVLVIAAAGTIATDGPALPAPVPAAYPGVLGVSAIDAAGVVDPHTFPGSHVDLAAPGVSMVAAAPARGHTTYSGSDLAAASTAGVASLVMAGRPELSANAVAARLIATADPAPGGAHSPSYGAGIVNPVRALSEPLASPAGGPIGESIPLPLRSEQPGPGPAVAVAGVFAVASLAVIGFAVLRRARRRLAREQGY